MVAPATTPVTAAAEARVGPCEAAAPWRVRWAMWVAFALIAALCGAQAWQAREQERLRDDAAAMLALAGEQRAFTQSVARLALLAASGVLPAPEAGAAVAALGTALERSRAQALQLDSLLGRHGIALQPQADWQASRERLWARSELLRRQFADDDPSAALNSARIVQRESERAMQSAQLLVDELQSVMRRHGDEAVRRAQIGAIVVVLLLAALGLLVVEPGARAVRRHVERLAAQTADLERLALVAERTHSVVLVTDAERRVVWANDAFTRLTGYTLPEVLGRNPGRLLQTEHTDAQTVERMRQAFDSGEGLRVEMLNRAKDGREYWLDADMQPLHDTSGALTGFVAVQTDITGQVTQRLRTAALLAALPTGVVVQAGDGTVTDANPAAETMLGLSHEQLLGSDPLDPGWRALYEDGSELPVADRPAMRTLRSGRGLRGEAMGVKNASGAVRWLLVNTEPLHDAFGRPDGVVSCYADITEGRRLQDQLSRGARIDALTELPNRTVVQERVQRAIEHSRRHPGYGFAVLFMDFDRFKQVNDTLGHGVGDELLRQIAQRLTD
ncbi:MAG TPA: PAS domain S-box protein, partial [Rubrivivax sp.]|nr:PAS domain S-box protein [Rubrivivax sp.]